jgi:Holliday junction resolvase RusA-like endonuclease
MNDINILINNINENNKIEKLIFSLNIEPEAYKRPRSSYKVKGKFYNPNAKYISNLKKEIKTKLDNKFNIIKGEIEIELKFYLIPPKNISNSKTKLELIINNIIHPITRPDLDNYIKPVLDAMNNLIYNDDGQIYKISASKLYTENNSHIEVIINYREDKIKLR